MIVNVQNEWIIISHVDDSQWKEAVI